MVESFWGHLQDAATGRAQLITVHWSLSTAWREDAEFEDTSQRYGQGSQGI
jgi:hypothetical protein